MRISGIEAVQLLLGKARNRDLVVSLTRESVQFTVVGGTALAYHGLRDVADVDDLDLLLAPNKSNADGIARALNSQENSYQASHTDLLRPGIKVPLKDRNFYAELLIADKHINAEAIYAESTLVSLVGLTVRIASINRLRIMKEQAIQDCIKEIESRGEALEKHKRDLFALNNK